MIAFRSVPASQVESRPVLSWRSVPGRAISAGLLLLAAGSAAAEDKILPITDSPVRIVEFSSSLNRADQDELVFSVDYVNVSERTVLATRICFRAYDLFRDLSGEVCGIVSDTLHPASHPEGKVKIGA